MPLGFEVLSLPTCARPFLNSTVEPWLKPRRGGLFIAYRTAPDLLFVFQRRACERSCKPCRRGVPLKNKKKVIERSHLAINRPPLRGLRVQSRPLNPSSGIARPRAQRAPGVPMRSISLVPTGVVPTSLPRGRAHSAEAVSCRY